MTHRQEKGCFQSVGGFKERYAERKGFGEKGLINKILRKKHTVREDQSIHPSINEEKRVRLFLL